VGPEVRVQGLIRNAALGTQVPMDAIEVAHQVNGSGTPRCRSAISRPLPGKRMRSEDRGSTRKDVTRRSGTLTLTLSHAVLWEQGGG